MWPDVKSAHSEISATGIRYQNKIAGNRCAPRAYQRQDGRERDGHSEHAKSKFRMILKFRDGIMRLADPITSHQFRCGSEA